MTRSELKRNSEVARRARARARAEAQEEARQRERMIEIALGEDEEPDSLISRAEAEMFGSGFQRQHASLPCMQLNC